MSDTSQQRVPRLSPAVAAVRVAVRPVVADCASASRTEPLIVAFSGGADSLALLRATCFEARQHEIAVVAVTIDHGLQVGSAQVAQRAAQQALDAGAADARVVRVAVGTEGGIEAAARTARYSALAEVARDVGSSTVFVGHTFDDQAETVLLGLTRGSGPGSVRGMPERDGLFVRPLLSIMRATTREACAAEGLDFWDDPHNVDESFVRVRIREKVLPELERDLGPGISAALVRTANLLRDDDDALNRMAEQFVQDTAQVDTAGVTVPVSALSSLFPAVRTRAIRLAARTAGLGSLSSTHTQSVDALVTDWHGQKALNLPGGNVERHEGRLVFTAT